MKLAALIFLPSLIFYTVPWDLLLRGSYRIDLQDLHAPVMMPGSTGFPNAKRLQLYHPPSSSNFRQSREIGQDCTRQFLFK